MPPEQFDYDAFISYASEDRPWAARLAESLEKKGLKVFLDQEGLRVGEEWALELLDALQSSRHLILLWSEHAKDSGWVFNENTRFHSFLIDAERRQQGGDRKVLQVVLEGQFVGVPTHQAIGVLRDEKVYGAGANAVEDSLWERVVEPLDEAIRLADDSLPVPVLVLTSTETRMTDVDPDRQPDGGGSALNALLPTLGTDRNELLGHYGPARTDWRPFGSDRPVRKVLEALKDELNLVLQGAEQRRFDWRYLDESAVWDRNDEVTDAEIARLEAKPSLIVVDPLAFYDSLVVHRYSNHLQNRFFADGDTFILVLAPFSLPRPAEAVRDTIRSMARQVFTHYYEPPVFLGARQARCGANIGDEMDFKGWLMSMLGPYVTPGPEPLQPAVLRTGSG